MIRNPQAKAQASILVREMQEAGIVLKHQQALEMVAKMSGHRDWNAMSSAPTVKATEDTSLSPGDLAALTAKLSKLQELAADVLDNCDDECRDEKTVTSRESVEALRGFIDAMGEMQKSTHPLIDFDPATQIAVIWCVDDVLSVREDLSEEQALEVLQTARRRYDANVGINWDVLYAHADLLVPDDSDDSDDSDDDNDD
jgi:hypothetical protein